MSEALKYYSDEEIRKMMGGDFKHVDEIREILQDFYKEPCNIVEEYERNLMRLIKLFGTDDRMVDIEHRNLDRQKNEAIMAKGVLERVARALNIELQQPED
jgi:hypothetical protein